MIFRNQDGLIASIANWLAFVTYRTAFVQWYVLQRSLRSKMDSGLGPIFFLPCEDCGVKTDTICKMARWSTLSLIWCPSCRLPKLEQDARDQDRRLGYGGITHLEELQRIVKGVPEKIAASDHCTMCPQYVKCLTLGV